MFGFMKKKETEMSLMELPPLEVDGEKEIICAPIQGEIVPCSEIRDLTFQKEMLGKCVAIKPLVGKVHAPADGKIEMIIETMHVINMTTENATEILVHVGIDTVGLKGQHYKVHVKEGSRVKRGDLLMEFDLAAISAEGYDLVSPVIICNSDDYKEIEKTETKTIRIGETIMKLTK